MASPVAVAEVLTQAFGPGVLLEAHLEGSHPHVVVAAAVWPQVAELLKNDRRLDYVMLRSITGLDYPQRQQIVAAYDLLSLTQHAEFCVKVAVDRTQPAIPSVAAIWPAADWHEREAYDLFGIIFTGHPDVVTDAGITHPRRILLPDDWQGFPLRKDYEFPREYQGIPGSVELDWVQKPNYPK